MGSILTKVKEPITKGGSDEDEGISSAGASYPWHDAELE
jgi:hypothetical protein